MSGAVAGAPRVFDVVQAFHEASRRGGSRLLVQKNESGRRLVNVNNGSRQIIEGERDVMHRKYKWNYSVSMLFGRGGPGRAACSSEKSLRDKPSLNEIKENVTKPKCNDDRAYGTNKRTVLSELS